MQVNDDANINEKINQVCQTTTFLESQNGYDIYQDALGQKILIPTIQKTGGHNNAYYIASCCDQELIIMGNYIDCRGCGDQCTWIEKDGCIYIAICRQIAR